MNRQQQCLPRGSWMKLRSPETLRALMEQDDFSLGRLARYAGCHKSFIAHLLAGRRKCCTTKLGLRIAEALDVPVSVLFEVHKSPTSTSKGKQQRSKRAAA